MARLAHPLNDYAAKSRAAKQLGDFGEGLVTYVLIRKGFEVACVDHVGADLIAQRAKERIAISVKTRLYKPNSTESRGTVIRSDHIEKLEHFAKRFELQPVFAHVVSIPDDRTIHLFILRVGNIKRYLDKAVHGYCLRFSEHHLTQTITLPYVDYSFWRDETIGSNL